MLIWFIRAKKRKEKIIDNYNRKKKNPACFLWISLVSKIQLFSIAFPFICLSANFSLKSNRHFCCVRIYLNLDKYCWKKIMQKRKKCKINCNNFEKKKRVVHVWDVALAIWQAVMSESVKWLKQEKFVDDIWCAIQVQGCGEWRNSLCSARMLD